VKKVKEKEEKFEHKFSFSFFFFLLFFFLLFFSFVTLSSPANKPETLKVFASQQRALFTFSPLQWVNSPKNFDKKFLHFFLFFLEKSAFPPPFPPLPLPRGISSSSSFFPSEKMDPPSVQIKGIFEAAQQGSLQVLQSLIVSGEATPNDRDSANTTPLHWAAINNHLVVVQYLVGAGAEVDTLGGDLMSTPLHWAVRQGHLQVTFSFSLFFFFFFFFSSFSSNNLKTICFGNDRRGTFFCF